MDSLRLAVMVSILGLAMATEAATRPVVLELFTSEGCSSCPPAEAIVSELAQRTDVLPLSFHVDYWDGLGWHDRYSLASATERQEAYARTLRRSSVYTPQAIVDGSLDVVGSRRDAVLHAVAGGRDGIATTVSVSDGKIEVHIGSGSQPSMAADVLLIGYLHEATTHIGRGENSGRTIRESNIVLALTRLGEWRGKASDFQLQVSSLPENVTDVAVLLQSSGQGTILGAATHPTR